MAKSPPEKLAAALRANLKRRKQGLKGPKDGRVTKHTLGSPRPESPPKPPKNSA